MIHLQRKNVEIAWGPKASRLLFRCKLASDLKAPTVGRESKNKLLHLQRLFV